MEWEDIAQKLLDKKLFLSALELYYELLEHNCEIGSLRDFFSNPGNFETFYNIPRSTSLQTFDSLDLVSRYSDDDPVNVADERVTVLEFELRKAQETINALRGTITTSAAPEHKERSIGQGDKNQGGILPYEKRCLNFLIAEYLLENNYKLSGITLAEEAGDEQDVEDWEDVGLNCPRPPSLLAVYRTSDHHQIQALEQKCRGLEEKCSAMTEEMNASISQITQLKKLLADYEENKKSNSPTNEVVGGVDTKKSGSEDNVIVYLDRGTVRTMDERSRRQMSDCSVITQDSTDKDIGSAVGSMNSYSTNDESIKRHEVEKGLADATRESPVPGYPSVLSHPAAKERTESSSREGSILSASEDAGEDEGEDGGEEEEVSDGEKEEEDCGGEEKEDCGEEMLKEETLVCQSPASTEHDGMDNHVIGTEEVTLVIAGNIPGDATEDHSEDDHVECAQSDTGDDETDDVIDDIVMTTPESQVSPFFVACLRSIVGGSAECRLSQEISHISDDPVLVMGRCLPHIMPHVLLNKREELLPVILCLAVQHPDPSQRDSLLHLLFNLVKKPDFEQRQIIRAGCEAFARSVDLRRLEEELLPQCWEQITDKFVERRLLVAETCGTLSAHLSEDVCSSLVVSILKQVLDDKDESVRESAVKNLSLVITRVNNDLKATELLQILTSALQDPSSKVQQTALQVYLPTLSLWLISQNRYLTECYGTTILNTLIQSIKSGSYKMTSVYLQSLTISNVFLLASLLKPLIAEISNDTSSRMSESTEESHFDLLDPHVVLNVSRSQLTSLLSQFNTRLVQKTLPESVETQVNWYSDVAITCIIECIKNFQNKALISEFSAFFLEMQSVLGRTFIQRIIKPALKSHVSDLRVLPVYCTGMLTLTDEDRSELREFLNETLLSYSSQYLDVDPLTETFAELSKTKVVLSILVGVLNSLLKEAISPQIKNIVAKICKGLCDAADPVDIASHVLPILSRLANDPDEFVQTSTISCFTTLLQRCPGCVSTVREQLDKFISEAVSYDVHVMMCELLDSFTLVLPICTADIQRDFLIPRLATIGVSNSAITNKTKRRDLTERLISAYRAILCSSLSADTIEHYILPGLQALSIDAQEVIPEKQQVIDLMFKEVVAKTQLSQRDNKSSTVFGSKMSGFFKKK